MAANTDKVGKFWAEMILAGKSDYKKVVARFPKNKAGVDWWLKRKKWKGFDEEGNLIEP